VWPANSKWLWWGRRRHVSVWDNNRRGRGSGWRGSTSSGRAASRLTDNLSRASATGNHVTDTWWNHRPTESICCRGSRHGTISAINLAVRGHRWHGNVASFDFWNVAIWGGMCWLLGIFISLPVPSFVHRIAYDSRSESTTKLQRR